MKSTTEDQNQVIVISHLNHYFGQGQIKQQVLFDINLQVKSGEIVLMTGPSGSGKTTLLTLIGALRSPHDGSVKILGKELWGASSQELVEARKSNGYIFQAHNLHRSLTAMQNVAMGLEVHGNFDKTTIHEKSMAMLEEVGLSERMSYYPDSLSGGQKQRVAIARALVSRPSLVLADEPTAALDSKSGRDVVDLMQKLAREQKTTIILVTHDSRILDIADRIVSLEDGRLIKG
ncbi:DevA family ABC transporter ATP-binding protein [Geminocystis sp.]|uniref:DevA family ABC transporter ATP-binding protein n=1 Tax=Geminocystis sp. TaxID=2664100 RepID=UPI003592FDE7